MPYSQLFEKGYIAVRDDAYIDYVKSRMIQLELDKGDAVFFNPATFHQPGVNVTDEERVANLLQVSSAFGRSMESCDRTGMAKAVWPVMKRWHSELGSGDSTKHQTELDALIAATCSDYGYPKIFDLSVVSRCNGLLWKNSDYSPAHRRLKWISSRKPCKMVPRIKKYSLRLTSTARGTSSSPLPKMSP